MTTTPEQHAALDAIQAVLSEHAEALSPTGDGMASEWVLVVNWIGQENGESHIASVIPAHLLISHRSGLLYEALHGSWHREDDE